jgi:carbonic anhydrase
VIHIRAAGTEDIPAVRELFQEYAGSLGHNLHFQSFDAELAELPGPYQPPLGRLFLALVDGTPEGCVGVRPQEDGVCEMKRLYVRPTARGLGLGRALAEAAIAGALEVGYDRMRLDSLPTMTSAQRLYRQLGFYEIPAYRFNPIAGTVFMELDLRRPPI